MLKKLQRRFIMVAAGSYLIVMLFVLGVLNGIVMFRTYTEVFEKLSLIADNMGEAPEINFSANVRSRYITVEFPYESRYFSVLSKNDGSIETVSIAHIAAIDKKGAEDYASYVLENGNTRGFMRITEREDLSSALFRRKNLSRSDEIFWNTMYAYEIRDTDDGKLVVFLDYTSEDAQARNTIFLSCCIGIFSFALVLFFVMFFSRKIVLPMIKNIERQKSFITNAGHELKTPLAIISANAEVIEMTSGENEWTKSIRNQITRLTGLVNSLIRLSRLQENNERPKLTTIDYSACVTEIAESFRPLIENAGKELTIDISEGISGKGEENALKELTNILMDNAQKYCDDGGSVNISLTKETFRTVMKVSNSYANGENEDCSRYFDRFYRGDESHSSKKSGYGIGLSMAQGLAELLKGKLDASWHDGVITFSFTV